MRHQSAVAQRRQSGSAEEPARSHQSGRLREKPTRCSPESMRRKADLAEVEGEDAVLGLDVVPAALLDLLAQVLQLVVGEADRDHLAALEADLHLAARPPSVPSFAGSTISVSTPPVERGCRKATRLSRIPTRGSASISSIPAAASRASVASMSSTA